jgi:hypothetical protein
MYLNSVSSWVSAIIICGALYAPTSAARADIPVEFYQSSKGAKSIAGLKDYIVGLGRGVFWANASLAAAGKAQLFCMPPKLKSRRRNYIVFVGPGGQKTIIRKGVGA